MARITLKKQNFTITGKDDIEVNFVITEEKVVLANQKGGIDFVFDGSKNLLELERWAEVIKLMGMAIEFAKLHIEEADPIYIEKEVKDLHLKTKKHVKKA